MNPGMLDRRIEVQRASVAQGRFGSEEQTWSTLFRPWARRMDHTGDESDTSKRERGSGKITYRIRWERDLKMTDRIVYEGQVHDILWLTWIGRRKYIDVLTELHADEQGTPTT